MLKNQEGSHILTRIVSLLDFISLHQLQLHKNHAAGTFHTQYTAYQKHQCHRCDAPTSPPLILDFSLWTCFCGSHFFHAPPLPIEWQE